MNPQIILEVLSEQLPVLFLNIGWALHYDGSEPITGNHRYLAKEPENNSESRAFYRNEQRVYQCGIAKGDIGHERIHIVFVARSPQDRARRLRVVGLYGAATPRNTSKWNWAQSKYALLIPADRRPLVTNWPSGQGMRRWAAGGSKCHAELAKLFQQLRRNITAILEKPTTGPELPPDQTYADAEAIEGQQRKMLVLHRKRETRLRRAKILDALAKNSRLVCEVPGCQFDFEAQYGPLGAGYAHVHHLKPLAKTRASGKKVTLDGLAIVCANCHSMIHRGGQCRDLLGLIPQSGAETK